VPKDLKLAGREERFTITVTFDTKELYGTVVGKRTVVIASDD